MKVLLDTQAFLWMASDWKRVASAARRILANVETQLYFSAASIWEISIKTAIGRLSLPTLPPVYVPRRIADFGISVVDITRDHTLAVYTLPPHHADPFDRMIVAQAKLEELVIATSDRIFCKYGVGVLPIG